MGLLGRILLTVAVRKKNHCHYIGIIRSEDNKKILLQLMKQPTILKMLIKYNLSKLMN